MFNGGSRRRVHHHHQQHVRLFRSISLHLFYLLFVTVLMLKFDWWLRRIH